MSRSRRGLPSPTLRARDLLAHALAVALALAAVPAHAALQPIGDPTISGSWNQRFQVAGVGPFDRVELLAASGGPFELPTSLSLFNMEDWSQTCSNTIECGAGGSLTGLLQWNVTFQGPRTSPLAFYLQAFNGGVVVETDYAEWNGASWRVDQEIPEPSPWSAGTPCAHDDAVLPIDPMACLTAPSACLVIPVVILRSDSIGIRAVSVTFSLAPQLALCGAPSVAIAQGSYLSSLSSSTTVFQAYGNADGSYTVDCALLGTPCGQTAATGTLFTVQVRGVSEGVGTIALTNVLLRDCSNTPIGATLGPQVPVPVDFTPPPAVAGLSAAPWATGNDFDGTTKIEVAWTPQAPGTTVLVYRAGFGHYPEYDDAGGATPGVPAYPPGSPWVLAGTVTSGSSLADEVATRDFWYYVAFARDACGNVSAASARTSGALNYHLGDVSDGVLPGRGNNRVYAEDLSLLGVHYGASLAPGDTLEYLDVGPTTDFSVNARPTTDHAIDFEDLIMFAVDYGMVSAPAAAALPVSSGADVLTLEAPERVSPGEEFPVTLRLVGGGDLQGLTVRLGWDASVAEPLAVQAGALLAAQNGVALSSGPGDVDCVVLGPGRVLAGSGALATVTFRAVAAGAPRVSVARCEGRDGANRAVRLGADPAEPTPAATALAPAAPNPFQEGTTLAFSLGRGGPVELALYSVDGRRVRTLARDARRAGSYRIAWDGTDDAGRRVSPGIFYARLVTPDGSLGRTLVKMR